MKRSRTRKLALAGMLVVLLFTVGTASAGEIIYVDGQPIDSDYLFVQRNAGGTAPVIGTNWFGWLLQYFR